MWPHLKFFGEVKMNKEHLCKTDMKLVPEETIIVLCLLYRVIQMHIIRDVSEQGAKEILPPRVDLQLCV